MGAGDRWAGAAAVVTLHQSTAVNKAKYKSEALDLLVDIRPYPHLWSRLLLSVSKRTRSIQVEEEMSFL